MHSFSPVFTLLWDTDLLLFYKHYFVKNMAVWPGRFSLHPEKPNWGSSIHWGSQNSHIKWHLAQICPEKCDLGNSFQLVAICFGKGNSSFFWITKKQSQFRELSSFVSFFHCCLYIPSLQAEGSHLLEVILKGCICAGRANRHRGNIQAGVSHPRCLSMRSYQAVVRGLPVQHSLRKRGQEIHSIFSPPNTVLLEFIFGLPCTSSVDTPTYNYNCFRMFWGGLNKMLPEIILLKSKRSGFILVQWHWTWNPVASSTISSEMIWWTSNTKWRGDLAGQKASGKAAWVVTKMFRSFPHNREELLII